MDIISFASGKKASCALPGMRASSALPGMNARGNPGCAAFACAGPGDACVTPTAAGARLCGMFSNAIMPAVISVVIRPRPGMNARGTLRHDVGGGDDSNPRQRVRDASSGRRAGGRRARGRRLGEHVIRAGAPSRQISGYGCRGARLVVRCLPPIGDDARWRQFRLSPAVSRGCVLHDPESLLLLASWHECQG